MVSRWRTELKLYKKTKPLAREMRLKPTDAEKLLWGVLRKERLGVKFRRQHVIGPYIVDFYAPSARLVVEVDGPTHEFTHEYDVARDAYLAAVGLKVVRFSNQQIFKTLYAVVAEIRANVASNVTTPSWPPP